MMSPFDGAAVPEYVPAETEPFTLKLLPGVAVPTPTGDVIFSAFAVVAVMTGSLPPDPLSNVIVLVVDDPSPTTTMSLRTDGLWVAAIATVAAMIAEASMPTRA
jgi:hypothetical protein